MGKICRLEKESLKLREKLLNDLEETVVSQDIDADIQRFIQKDKKTEFTHKYSKALELLDWDFAKRYF